jgi:hypothetical protein
MESSVGQDTIEEDAIIDFDYVVNYLNISDEVKQELARVT